MTAVPTSDKQVRSARSFLVGAMAAIAAVGGAYWLLMVRPNAAGLSYFFVDNRIQFAGTPGRLDGQLEGVSVSDARTAVAFSLLFAFIWGVVGLWLLTTSWDVAWRTGWGHKAGGRTLAFALAGGGLAAAVVEKTLTLVSLTEVSGAVTHRHWSFAAVIVAFAWIKWLFAGMLICAVFALTVSTATMASRRKLADPDPNAADVPGSIDPNRPPSGIGICCSGGGIRAAGFALGCLSRLEEPFDSSDKASESVLTNASYLASVSGGGYAASAWRIAAGTGAELPSKPIIGNPLKPDRSETIARHRERSDNEGSSVDLLDHIQQRRRYLANGPGGLWRSLLRAIRNTGFHFFLVVSVVFVAAWPLGRIIVSWAVTGNGLNNTVMSNGLPEVAVGVHRWFPPLFLSLVGLIGVFLRLGEENTTFRRRLDIAIKAAMGTALLVAAITLVLPWAVDGLVRLLPTAETNPVAVGGIYGLIVTAVWHYTKNKLRPMARYLGGVFLAVGLAGFGLYVTASAADVDEPLSSPWIWLGALVFLIVAFVFFNPDRWSLHSIYRTGLTATFASHWDDNAGVIRPRRAEDEPTLDAYRDAAGPIPVVCCAAARKDRSQTGIKVLSMTFDPESITVHGWTRHGSEVNPDARRLTHAEFHRRRPKPFGGTPLNTLMGAAAISGAAVAPSLGRMDMKSTNALLAAFNARLGVWIPNPRESFERSTTPRLVNMFKEILGMFNDDDPNVYATDGGHWENLGLVELIRRRCALIIAIDTSGDPPGTYQTLKEAIDLADLECGAEIDLTAALDGDLLAENAARPAKNYGLGTISYADDADGADPPNILYVKAAVAKNSPLHIRRYAAGDPRFPNYSTSDQLLGEDEFLYMVQLGYDATNQALEEHTDTIRAALHAKTTDP